MSSVKYPLVGGRVMRATRLDSCGRPAWGDKTEITSDGFVSVAVTANYDDGEEVTVTNAWGKRCITRDAEPELINLSVDVVFCQVDPEFYTTFTGFPPIIDPATGNVIGYALDRSVRPADIRNAFEVWAGAAGTEGCDDEDSDLPWGYFIWPFITGGRVGDYTIENAAVTFSVTGMISKDGSLWGEGPYLVQTDENGDPAVLQLPITGTMHQQVFVTTVQPPEPSIGLVPLDDPAEGAATGATAGIPGVWTPAGAVRPEDFAELDAGAYTASPLTAWTTGQHVILGDGSTAHWNSTDWVAGTAP